MRYYILVSYRIQNDGMEPSLACDAADTNSDVEPGCAAPCLQAEESTCMRHGTFVNACRSLTRKRRNCNLIDKVILVFFVLFNITVELLMSRGLF